MRTLGVALVVMATTFSVSCGSSDEPLPLSAGPLATNANAAANDSGVPRDLLLAIAVTEGGLALPRWRTPHPDDHVPVAGILELRHGKLDTLALGASLVGTDELTLRSDTDLGTLAGARVLASLGPKDEPELVKWKDAIAELSGLGEPERSRYVARVFRVLTFGGDFPARDGETVHVGAHPEIPPGLGIVPPALTLDVDFPGSQWFQTDCTNKCTDNRPDGNDSVDSIVIHDTEGGWDASVATLQYDAGKSVHYIIDADGSRWGQFVPETYTAWHAGNWCWNKHSVGIEHVGVASNASGYQAALYAKSVEMVKNIMSRWPNIPLDRDHIVGHYQIPNGNAIAECSAACSDGLDACEQSPNYGGSNNHRDPGYYWQWCEYMEMLGTSCHCNDAWPLWNCTTDKTEAWRCNAGSLEKLDCTNGCDVMQVGTDDVCHTAPDSGAAGSGGSVGSDAGTKDSGLNGGTGGGSSGSGGKDAGASGGSKNKSHVESADDGGCSCRTPARNPEDASLLALAAALAAVARRRAKLRGTSGTDRSEAAGCKRSGIRGSHTGSST